MHQHKAAGFARSNMQRSGERCLELNNNQASEFRAGAKFCFWHSADKLTFWTTIEG